MDSMELRGFCAREGEDEKNDPETPSPLLIVILLTTRHFLVLVLVVLLLGLSSTNSSGRGGPDGRMGREDGCRNISFVPLQHWSKDEITRCQWWSGFTELRVGNRLYMLPPLLGARQYARHEHVWWNLGHWVALCWDASCHQWCAFRLSLSLSMGLGLSMVLCKALFLQLTPCAPFVNTTLVVAIDDANVIPTLISSGITARVLLLLVVLEVLVGIRVNAILVFARLTARLVRLDVRHLLISLRKVLRIGGSERRRFGGMLARVLVVSLMLGIGEVARG